MKINKLSNKTIQELVELVKHFDLGIEIKVDVEEREISIIGHSSLNEQGDITHCRHYDFTYRQHCNGKVSYNHSDEMIEEIERHDKILEKANLYEHYESCVTQLEEDDEI